MRFGHHVLQQIRQAIHIADIVGQRVRLYPSGAQLRGACPFHQEKDPSFYVYPDKGFFICYGCQAKGDIFDFLMLSEGLTFSDAVMRAAQIAGIEITPVSAEENEHERAQERHRQRLYKANREAADFFRASLQEMGAAHAREYLEKRGLGPEVLHRYQIGYAPDSWEALTQHMQSIGMFAEALEVGLVRKSKENRGHYDFFRDRIMFPISDSFGNVRGFSSRILNPERPEGKYVNSPESIIYTKSQSVYGLYEVQRQVRQEKRVILVEGNIDVLTLAQKGLPAVAPLGTALTGAQIQLLKRYTDNIWLMFDGDAAGRKATLRALPLLLEGNSTGKIVLLPEPHDPDSFVREQGTHALAQLMERALPVFDTFLRMNLPASEAPISERTAALSLVQNVWKWIPTVSRDAYINQIALMLRLKPQDIRTQLPVRMPSGFQVPAATAHLPTGLTADEKSEFIRLLNFVCFLHRHESLANIDALNLDHALATPAVRDAWRQIRESRLWSDLERVKEILPPAAAQKLPEIADSMKNLPHPEETLNELLQDFELQSIRRQIRDVEARIQEAVLQKNQDLRLQLLEKRIHLERIRNQLVQNRGFHDNQQKNKHSQTP